MAIAWATIQDALYDAAKAALPTCAVVWTNQADLAPMPAKPFVALNLTVRDRQQGLRGGDEQTATDGNGVRKIAHHRRHVLSVNVYSNSTHGDTHATAMLGALVRSLRLELRVLALRTAGCKVWQESEVRGLTAILDTRGESRAQCDLTVATLDTTSETVGYIETVDLTGITVD